MQVVCVFNHETAEQASKEKIFFLGSRRRRDRSGEKMSPEVNAVLGMRKKKEKVKGKEEKSLSLGGIRGHY